MKLFFWRKRKAAKPVQAPTQVAWLYMSGEVRDDDASRLGRPNRHINYEAVKKALQNRKLKRHKLAALVLVMNSPGGSPYQAQAVSEFIDAYVQPNPEKDEPAVPVYAVVQGMAASAGYWIICSADQIWAAPTSLVGSIGVVSAMPDFSGLMDKAGVGFNYVTQGENKVKASPFKPFDEKARAFFEGLQVPLFAMFKARVESRRGAAFARANQTIDQLATGDVWLGDAARELGLVDRIGFSFELEAELDKLGKTEHIHLTQPKPGLLQRLFRGGAEAFADVLLTRLGVSSTPYDLRL